MDVQANLLQYKKEVEDEYFKNLEPFWKTYSVDETNGGFWGRIQADNTPVTEADKGGILNARILWAFSAAFRKYGTKESEKLAHRAYSYLTNYLFDQEHGGVYWKVNFEGKSSDERKHVYVQAFSIYGLTEYYAAFGNEEALNHAKNLYDLIEKNCVDEEYGGYFESYTRDWSRNKDARLSKKDKNEPKSMNTHLHVLEGYTNLYRFAPNEKLRRSLEKLLELFHTYIFNNEKESLVCFFDTDWTHKSELISYGHNIEASWLCCEAADVLGNKKWIDAFNTVAVNVGNAVIEGTDLDGGIINERTPEKIVDSNKDWWPQAEAMIGFMNAYEITKEEKFLAASLKSWEFIKTYLIDPTYGEWFEKVDRNGVPFNEMDKVRSWKAPYHNCRALFEISLRANKLITSKNGSASSFSIAESSYLENNK